MFRSALIFILTLTATPALPESPMGAAAFDAYTTGRTLFFARNGQSYGAEQYFEGRRVRWSFLDGECRDGHWYPDGPNICFLYEHDPDPHCWQFRQGPGGLIAAFQDGSGQPPLYEAQDMGEEMVCLGPKVGV